VVWSRGAPPELCGTEPDRRGWVCGAGRHCVGSHLGRRCHPERRRHPGGERPRAPGRRRGEAARFHSDGYRDRSARSIRTGNTSWKGIRRPSSISCATANGADGQRAIEITAAVGAQVTLDAAGSRDPDHDRIAYRWWQYPEPSIPAFDLVRPPDLQIQGDTSIRASFVVPSVTRRTSFHVILEARDDGTPPLTSYRRVIVTVDPAAVP
jgi:hypothetical protein